MKKKMEKTELEKRLEAEIEQEEHAEEAEETKPESGEEVAVEEVDIDTLITERDDFQDQLLRTRAEFDNYRKRIARDNEQLRKRAAQSLVNDLLPVVDHLELALQHSDDDSGSFIEGIEMVLKQFGDVLKNHGVKSIAAVGEKFDPNVHDAMMQAPSEEHPEDIVVQEYQRGYMMGDMVIRPAKVIVSSGPAEESETTD